MTDVILQYLTNGVGKRTLSSCFQNCELLFDISRFFTIDSICEVC